MTATTHMTIWPQAAVVDLWQEHLSARPHLQGLIAEALVQMINPLHVKTKDLSYSWEICESPKPHVHLKMSIVAPRPFWTPYLDIFDVYLNEQVASLRLWLKLPAVTNFEPAKVSFGQRTDVIGPILCQSTNKVAEHALAG